MTAACPSQDSALCREWTRSDSNRRSSPCKGDAFPLGHGPVPGLLLVPTRGLEPPHLSVIDPKSIASAIPPRRHFSRRTQKFIICCVSLQIWGDVYSRFCPAPSAGPVIYLNPGSPQGWQNMAGRVLPDAPASLRRDSTAMQPNPLTLLPVVRSPSRSHRCGRW